MNVKTLDFSKGVGTGGGGRGVKRGWKEWDNAGYTCVWDIEKLIRKYFYSLRN